MTKAPACSLGGNRSPRRTFAPSRDQSPPAVGRADKTFIGLRHALVEECKDPAQQSRDSRTWDMHSCAAFRLVPVMEKRSARIVRSGERAAPAAGAESPNATESVVGRSALTTSSSDEYWEELPACSSSIIFEYCTPIHARTDRGQTYPTTLRRSSGSASPSRLRHRASGAPPGNNRVDTSLAHPGPATNSHAG